MRNQRTSVGMAAVVLYMAVAVLFCSVVTIKDMIERKQLENENRITNPKNWEYVVEVAFNLEKAPNEVSQAEFNARYVE